MKKVLLVFAVVASLVSCGTLDVAVGESNPNVIVRTYPYNYYYVYPRHYYPPVYYGRPHMAPPVRPPRQTPPPSPPRGRR